MILTEHFNLTKPIPKETITCWIDGTRRPKNAFEVLKDDELIEEEFKKIVDDLTDQYMDYHIAKALHDNHNWSYSKISKILNLDKEKVRGWVKKNRGNPVAKCFKNRSKVEEEIKKYIDLAPNGGKALEEKRKDIEVFAPSKDFNEELEDEILYHLSFFPSGVSSPQALKSILIDNKDASLEDILEVLDESPRIIRRGNRWIIKD